MSFNLNCEHILNSICKMLIILIQDLICFQISTKSQKKISQSELYLSYIFVNISERYMYIKNFHINLIVARKYQIEYCIKHVNIFLTLLKLIMIILYMYKTFKIHNLKKTLKFENLILFFPINFVKLCTLKFENLIIFPL